MLVLLSVLLLKAVDVQTDCVSLATAGLLRQTIKLAPHSGFAHNLLGHTYYALNRTDLALHHLCRAEDLAEINDWKRTIRKEPHNVEAYLSLGQACYDANDFEAGKDAFNQALRIDPNCLDAYMGLSGYYWEIKDSEKALSLYEKVLEIDPENQNAHYMLAVEYAVVGMNEESETEMEYLSDNKRRASALWCMIGNIYRENGSSDRAISA